MAINKIQGNILSDNLIRGSNLAFQTDLIYLDIINGRIGINTASTTHDLTVNGNARVDNLALSTNVLSSDQDIVLQPTGNVWLSNVNINYLADPVVNSDAATKFYVDNTVDIFTGNFTFSNTTISTSVTPGNITLQPTGSSTVIIDTTSGLVLPAGNTAQQPSPAATGTVRFNTDAGRIEVYDGSAWDDVVANVTNQVLYGDNTTSVFTLDRDTTAAAALVAFNGVIQLPGVAYTVTGNQITFAQPPAVSDVIDVRFL